MAKLFVVVLSMVKLLARFLGYYYYKATGKKVNYQGIGSGGGIRQITKRVVDFGGLDKMLLPDGKLKLSNRAVCNIFMGNARCNVVLK